MGKIIFCALIIAGICFGQEGATFLNFTPGARAIGMAQCFTAIADDATACYYNPAGLAFITQPQMLSMNLSPPPGIAKATLWGLTELSHPLFCQKVHSTIDPGFDKEEEFGSHYYYWSAAFPFNYKQTIGLGINYFKYGPIKAYSKRFYSYHCALNMSYGWKIINNLSLGLSAKYIYEFFFPQWVLDSVGWVGKGSAQSFAFDGGILFKPGVGLSLGASLLNLGPRIQYPEYFNSVPKELPLIGRIGIAQSLTDLLEAAFENNNILRKINRFFDFTITVERRYDLWTENFINNTSWGFETKFFDLLSYRQGFSLTRKENSFFTYPKSIGVDFKIVEFDITITNSNYYAGHWWIQSKFKPLENKPEFLKENKVLDRIFLNLSCLAIPGGGQLYNGDKWLAMPFLIASFFVADVILESHTKPSWQDEAYNTVVMTLPMLYVLSGVEAMYRWGRRSNE
ncbi:MAG: hypothetical protein ACUVWN_17775 [bacterium]